MENNKLKNQINQIQNILESFGNAKTPENQNSSRFALNTKFFYSIENVKQEKQIKTVQIESFLLEKSRISKQQINERNFHIFYQFLAGKSNEELEKFHLKSKNSNDYNYLVHNTEINEENDKKLFLDLINTFELFEFDLNDQENIFKIIACILHIGNIDFIEENNQIRCKDQNLLENLSNLLEITKEELESIFTQNNNEKANQLRDKIAQEIYLNLFKYIITKINNKLNENQQQEENQLKIEILDLFGYENHKKNSLEQLLYNYTNEKIQNQINENYFQKEQVEYISENILWNVIKNTNHDIHQNIINLIEDQPFGIFPLLQNECNTNSNVKNIGSVDNFLKNLQSNEEDKNKLQININESSFSILHSLQLINYQMDEFIEKNKISFPLEIINLFKTSKFNFLIDLFTITDENEQKKEENQYLTSYYYNKLSKILQNIDKSEQHIIFCLNINDDDDYLLKQLYFINIIHLIQIRSNGFVYRKSFHEFLNNFNPLFTFFKIDNWNSLDEKNACHILLENIQKYIHENNNELSSSLLFHRISIGNSKVFLKVKEFQFLFNLLQNHDNLPTNSSLHVPNSVNKRLSGKGKPPPPPARNRKSISSQTPLGHENAPLPPPIIHSPMVDHNNANMEQIKIAASQVPPPPPPATVGPPPRPPPPATVGPPPRIPNTTTTPAPKATLPSQIKETNQQNIPLSAAISSRGRGRGRGLGLGNKSGALRNTDPNHSTTTPTPKFYTPQVSSHKPHPPMHPILPKGGLSKSPREVVHTNSDQPKELKPERPVKSISSDCLIPRAPKLSSERDDGLLAVVSTKLPKDLEFTGDSTEIHRQQVMQEFIVTEKGYLDDMYTLVEVFLNPIRQKEILSKTEITNIFCNIESLISVNVQFFRNILVYIDQFSEKKDFPLGKIFNQSVCFVFFFCFCLFCLFFFGI